MQSVLKTLSPSVFVKRLGVFLLLIWSVSFLLSYGASFRKLIPLYETNNYIPLTVSVFLLLFFFFNRSRFVNETHAVPFERRLLFSLFSLLFFALYFAGVYGLRAFFTNIYAIVITNYLLFFLGILCLAFAIFGTTVFLQQWRSVVTVFGVLSAFTLFSVTVTGMWRFFATIVLRTNVFLLERISSNVSYSVDNASLGVDAFRVIIGSPCSGIESMILFTGLYLFIYVQDHAVIRRKQFFLFYGIGLVGMFAMNILRIFVLMIIGAYVSPEIALGLFHKNAGWIIFVIYFLAYTYSAYPRFTLSKRASQTVSQKEVSARKISKRGLSKK